MPFALELREERGFQPVALGALSDRFGRRTVIIASLLIEAVSFTLSGLAGSLVLLLIARFVAGVGAANIGSARSRLAFSSGPATRTSFKASTS